MLFLFACTIPDDDKPADTDTGTDTGEPVELRCEDPVEPECVDDLIQGLSFNAKVSDGTIDESLEGEDFVALIDATAGGSSAQSRNPWLYVRFTPDGLQQVEVEDEESLEDMTWHLSLKRYILRLNSGDSGPSCVLGADVARKTYDEVTEVPDSVDWREEDFYDDDCELVADMLGGPETVLNGWWTYVSCVETTGTPYLLQLEDGSVVKLVVTGYYENDGQTECEETGATSEESGWVTIRWRFL
jgi:hypothetical protein